MIPERWKSHEVGPHLPPRSTRRDTGHKDVELGRGSGEECQGQQGSQVLTLHDRREESFTDRDAQRSLSFIQLKCEGAVPVPGRNHPKGWEGIDPGSHRSLRTMVFWCFFPSNLNLRACGILGVESMFPIGKYLKVTNALLIMVMISWMYWCVSFRTFQVVYLERVHLLYVSCTSQFALKFTK